MVESRWEVKIGALVMATDGIYGHLEQLLIDPHQERIVALLVRPHGMIPSTPVVVPNNLIANASENEVRLEINREQVETLPKFWPDSQLLVKNQFYKADDDTFAVRGKLGVEVGRAPNSREPGLIENQLSPSESEHLGLRGRTGQQVHCRDGYAGRVFMTLADISGRIIGFVLETGHLHRISRKQIVPAAWVHAVDKENIHLSVFKSDLESLPKYSPDDILAAHVENALWSIDFLQNTDYEEISVSVQDGIVILRGHVITMMNKTQIGDAVRSIAGVLGVENNLVVDQDLVIEVTQALGQDERTRYEWISVGAQNGVITLRGQVGSAAVREAAGEITASTPQVRGVINDLQAPDVVIDPEEHRFCQPLIDQDVYAGDMELGQVKRVILAPRSRRVTAFVVDGTFPDLLNKHGHRLPGGDPRQKRCVVIPISALRDISYNSILLEASGVEAAQNRDFNPADFISPPVSWKPPYPYRWEEVLLDK